jgi:hypothetical protein
LITAVDAVLNFKALLVLLLGLVVAAVILALLGSMGLRGGSIGLGAVGILLAALAVIVAINTAGILLMDEASGRTPRPVGDALLAGAFTVLGLLGLLAVGVIIFVCALAAWAVVYWVCTFPGIGPALFTVAFPVGVLFLGLLVLALLYVLFPIGAPALWAGEGLLNALARVQLVARKKLINVLVYKVVLLLVASIAAATVWLILFIGFALAGGMSAGLIGGLGVDSFGSMRGFSGGHGAYAYAGGIGTAVLAAAGLVIPFLIYMKGVCLIYLELGSELDVTGAEAQMRRGMAQIREKAEAARERVRQQNLAYRSGSHGQGGSVPAQPSHPIPQPPSSEGAVAPHQAAHARPAACPRCHAAVTAADAFCGNCGARVA